MIKRFYQIFKMIVDTVCFAFKDLRSNMPDERETAFMKHNRRIWRQFFPNAGKGEILIEATRMESSIISFSYLANVLARKHNARIVAYLIRKNSFTSRLSSRKIFRVYRSFNAQDFIFYQLSQSQSTAVNKFFRNIVPQLKNKKDVEDLHVDGLWIGDLLYDSHCMDYQEPTITLGSQHFHESLKKAISWYVFWRDYFKDHIVQSVIVSHTVYLPTGVITRLAIQRKIPVYQINATHLYYLTEKNLWAYNDFFYYPEQFRELPKEERHEGLRLAQERLQKRFSGKVGVDMHYSTKSAYGQIREKKVLKDSSRIKILVATHCFFDSPHPYGVNLFPDFYEWLYFLGEISEITDYDWYIKTHPDFLPGNIPIIQEFIGKFPKFSMIPSETSHLQLKEEGIDFGLTVYGTIGFEYAALGIPVVNASICNPRIRYHFNIHPQSVEEYRKILLNLLDQKIDIDVDEVYEYYYMAFIHNVNNWLFKDYDGFLREIGGYYKQFSSISYQKFMDQFSEERHQHILTSLIKFVESGEYNFRRKFLAAAAR